MDKERKKQLKGMLRAVQDKKEEYYIGTQDAFNYLKRIGDVYERPAKIAELINKKLETRLNITYPATPERIAGLNDKLSLPNLASDPELEEDPRVYLKENFPNLGFLKYTDIFNVLSSELRGVGKSLEKFFREEGDEYIVKQFKKIDLFSENTMEDYVQIFFPFFESANKEEIKTDEDFGIEIISVVKEEYEKIEGKIKEDMEISCSDYIEELTRDLSVVDWKKEFSKEKLREKEKERLDMNSSFRISLVEIVEKIKRDHLDHMLEYRRMVLCHWLKENKVKNYEEAIALYKERVELAERFSKDMMPISEEIIGESTKLIKGSLNFLKPLLYSEKNFIERFLRA